MKFISTLILSALIAYCSYSQNSYPKLTTQLIDGDTIVVAYLTIPQSRSLLQSKAELSHLKELSAQKDSTISTQQAHIDFLRSQISDYDSVITNYSKAMAFKNAEVDALEGTINIQQTQIKQQGRRKFIYIGSGVVVGFVAGIITGVLK